jgi:hypothetical protein
MENFPPINLIGWKKIPSITFLIYKKWKKIIKLSTYCYFTLILKNLMLLFMVNKQKLTLNFSRVKAGLFHQYHLFHLGEFSRLYLVEVDTAW